MFERAVFAPNSRFSRGYAAWEEDLGIYRAPLLWEGKLLGPPSRLDDSGQILAVSEGGTVVFTRGKEIVVWDSEGEVREFVPPHRMFGREWWVSVIPPLSSRKKLLGSEYLIRGSKEWIVIDCWAWRVEKDAIIGHEPRTNHTIIQLPNQRLFTSISLIARIEGGWIGAINHMLGIAFPEMDMVIAQAEFPAMLTDLACSELGVAVISGHYAYYSRWKRGSDEMISFSRWVKCGAAHRVMWKDDNNLLVILRDTDRTYLSRFTVGGG